MTHSTKTIAATMLLTIALFTNSIAQEKNAIATNQIPNPHNIFDSKEHTNSKTDVETNPVVTAKFSSLFPAATNQRWIGATDHHWVSFLNDGRNAKASFTLKGKLNYLITDCAMENLPEAFSKTITKEYASYQLFNAIEITAHGTVAYHAILESSKGYITLKYTSDGVEEIQRVKKQ